MSLLSPEQLEFVCTKIHVGYFFVGTYPWFFKVSEVFPWLIKFYCCLATRTVVFDLYDVGCTNSESAHYPCQCEPNRNTLPMFYVQLQVISPALNCHTKLNSCRRDQVKRSYLDCLVTVSN